MVKTIGKVLVVALLVAALGGIAYVLVGQDAAASDDIEAPHMPTARVEKGPIEKLVTGPGEVKPSDTEKLEMAKWRYFRSSEVPLNERIPPVRLWSNTRMAIRLLHRTIWLYWGRAFPKTSMTS